MSLLIIAAAVGMFLVLSSFVQADTLATQQEGSLLLAGSPGLSSGETLVEPEETVLTAPALTHPIQYPSRIVIPVIEVDVPIVPIGLDEDGTLETLYYRRAGWYAVGPNPGEPGPAVILGHVDTTKEPDVFYRLRELRPGDEILVYGADDDAAVFAVDYLEQQLKVELPKESIWDYTRESVIRLITCGGEYSGKTGHYLSNVIVYGHLVR